VSQSKRGVNNRQSIDEFTRKAFVSDGLSIDNVKEAPYMSNPCEQVNPSFHALAQGPSSDVCS